MPRSMTGYGAGRAEGPRLVVEAEVRSVNARNLKINLRAHPLLGPREPDIEGLVRRGVRRGSLTIAVRVHLLRPKDTIRIRPEVVEGLTLGLESLRRRGLVEGKLTPDAIAAIPGAVELGPDDPLRPADWRVAKAAVEAALEELDAMRQREAAHLVRDLRAILRRARKLHGVVRRRVPQALQEHHARLKERLEALLEPTGVIVDEATLAREIAVLADRSDVTEELTRLLAHFEEFEALLGRDGEVGRTLDFLAQEMLREVNTIGSKSGDVEVARAVIALKSDVERLKEQAANIE
jgi:uncharacterized protein (TIGR00255 family)